MKDKKKTYGENKLYQNHLLEQYRTFSDRVTAEEARDESINKFYLTLNAGLLAILAFVLKGADSLSLLYGVVCLLGIYINLVWFFSLKSMSNWLGAMQQTIQLMEKSLPYQPYSEAWKQASKASKLKIRSLKQLLPLLILVSYVSIFVLEAVGLKLTR